MRDSPCPPFFISYTFWLFTVNLFQENMERKIEDCCAQRRKDNKEVIFKKLEKVGEPYVAYGKVRQKYKLYIPLTITEGIIEKDISCDEVHGIVDIANKQN